MLSLMNTKFAEISFAKIIDLTSEAIIIVTNELAVDTKDQFLK